jgi:hypothetical protein
MSEYRKTKEVVSFLSWIKIHTSRQKEDLHGEESEPSHVFQSSVSM